MAAVLSSLTRPALSVSGKFSTMGSESSPLALIAKLFLSIKKTDICILPVLGYFLSSFCLFNHIFTEFSLFKFLFTSVNTVLSFRYLPCGICVEIGTQHYRSNLEDF
jgi:hypothetical protein